MLDQDVERVAKALFERWANDPFSAHAVQLLFGSEHVTWEQATGPSYVSYTAERFRDDARVAIAALREGLN